MDRRSYRDVIIAIAAPTIFIWNTNLDHARSLTASRSYDQIFYTSEFNPLECDAAST
jgi:hypothetical protein